MIAGRLRHRLEIQTASEVADPITGQPKKKWTTAATVWGSVEPMKGVELMQAQQVAPRVTHKITIRGRTPLTAANRIFFQERALNISYAMNQQERGITTIAYAMEVAA